MALRFIILIFSFSNVFGDGSKTIKSLSAFDQNLYEDVLDSALCDQQMAYLWNNTLGLRFADASAKIPSGILTGNLKDLGDYWQCLGIQQTIGELEIQGKYCIIVAPLDQQTIQWPKLPELPYLPGLSNITWPEIPANQETLLIAERLTWLQLLSRSGLIEPVNEKEYYYEYIRPRFLPLAGAVAREVTLAVCVPKVCTPTQAIEFLQSRIPLMNVTYTEKLCRLPNDKPFATADYVAMFIFSFIGLLTIISNTYDLFYIFIYKRDPKQVNSLYRSFSVYTNTRTFLTFKSGPGALECIDGIRAISMVWVVVIHTYTSSLWDSFHNNLDVFNWKESFTAVWVFAAPIAVDTFFFLSGLLAVYTTLGNTSRPRFIRSIHLFYIHRFLRLFPLLAALVLLQAFLINHVSDGPFWQNVAQETENCRQWWWTALLHVQNYVNPSKRCLNHTWYLSVDTQLYIMCPLVLVWMFGPKLYSWIALTAALLISLVSSSVNSFMFDLPAIRFNPSRYPESRDYMTKYYMNTLARAPPLFVGMVYGYILHLWRGKTIRVAKKHVAVLWLMSFLVMALCIFAIYFVMQRDHDAKVIDNLMNAYIRGLWSLALGWLVLACVHGYGGPVNWFLSLRMWKLPSKLSFAMYLVHMPIIRIADGSWVKTHYFSEGESMYRLAANLMLASIAAFLLSIFVEAPCFVLQKLLLGGGIKKKPLENIIESREKAVSPHNEIREKDIDPHNELHLKPV